MHIWGLKFIVLKCITIILICITANIIKTFKAKALNKTILALSYTVYVNEYYFYTALGTATAECSVLQLFLNYFEVENEFFFHWQCFFQPALRSCCFLLQALDYFY